MSRSENTVRARIRKQLLGVAFRSLDVFCYTHAACGKVSHGVHPWTGISGFSRFLEKVATLEKSILVQLFIDLFNFLLTGRA